MAKQSVKDFYDNEGWKYAGANSRDAIINENLTEIASKYVHSVRLRIFNAIGSGSRNCMPLPVESPCPQWPVQTLPDGTSSDD